MAVAMAASWAETTVSRWDNRLVESSVADWDTRMAASTADTSAAQLVDR